MELAVTRLTLRQRILLFWGKFRRFYYIALRPSYVEKAHSRRRGGCTHCGASCKLGMTCVAWTDDGEQGGCRVYKVRPPNCHTFPIDEADIRDRDLINPSVPCGFYFLSEEEALREERFCAQEEKTRAFGKEINAF